MDTAQIAKMQRDALIVQLKGVLESLSETGVDVQLANKDDASGTVITLIGYRIKPTVFGIKLEEIPAPTQPA